MARAMIRGLMRSGLSSSDIAVADTMPAARESCLEFVADDRIFSDLSSAGRMPFEVIVIAVKPQDAAVALREIAVWGERDILVISIVAGIATKSMENVLGRGARVVRAMPNSPALVGRGITAIAGGRSSRPEDLERASKILSSVGTVIEVEENSLDAVTAVSGSGPAYFFLLIRELISAGVELGLSRSDAVKLVLATAEGSAALATARREADGCIDCDALIAQVASKGGTTAAALQVFHGGGFGDIVRNAVRAAERRSRELGGEPSRT